jgi:membrane-bound lytic murein transglycosylase B
VFHTETWRKKRSGGGNRTYAAPANAGGTDGPVDNDTMKAIPDHQSKMGLLPADGYGGLKVPARLRQGS